MHIIIINTSTKAAIINNYINQSFLKCGPRNLGVPQDPFMASQNQNYLPVYLEK